jgi:spermidine synthase
MDSSLQESGTGAQSRQWLWQPGLIVFVSNTCVMTLELVAGRIVAPWVGVSLYTWTSVIGVVLAGISLGNYLGGRLADRWASQRLLGLIFLMGGLASCVVLFAERFGRALPSAWPVVGQILGLTAALFFVPSAVLGAVSPVVAKLAVRDLSRTGSVLGSIYAAGTVGSIVGTFATGFVLISRFGTTRIVAGVGLLLILMGAACMLGGRKRAVVVALLFCAGVGAMWAGNDRLQGNCTRETDYYCIKVHDEERDGSSVRVLILDRLVHSYTSLGEPGKLVYDYERVYAEATGYQADRHPDDLQALFIGGGGYTFPKYMEAIYPKSKLTVLEIDPGVTEIAYEQLGLSRTTQIVTHNQDARLYLKGNPDRKYHLILGDAFNDFSVPYHLTTKEFNDRVQTWMSPDGLYLVNLIDGPRRDFLRAYSRTLALTFPNVNVIPASGSWQTAQRTTYVVIGSNQPLEMSGMKPFAPADPVSRLASQVLPRETLVALFEAQPGPVLTDDYAPVDQMLAPVFRGEQAQ